MSDQVVLVVDVGNSRTKISVVRAADCEILDSLVGADISGEMLESLLAQYAPGGGIVCTSRGHVAGALTRVLDSYFGDESGFNGSSKTNNGLVSDNGSVPRDPRPKKLIHLSHLTPTPLVNTYKTPSTLGMDRLASSVGAAHLAPGLDLMVVDLGTALTIDFVSSRGEYLGGVISPGMSMRFRALHEMTGTLPLCHKSQGAAPMRPDDPLAGGSTKEAIERGVIQGMVLEIEGYAQKSGCEKIFFTGGDSFYFAERVKCAIFANCELVTIGLNQIFRYNAESKTE